MVRRRDWFEGSFNCTLTKASCGWGDTFLCSHLTHSCQAPKDKTTFGPLPETNFRGGTLLAIEEAAGDFQLDGLIEVLHLCPGFVSQLSEVLQTLCLKGRDQEGTHQAKGALRDLFDC